MILVKKGCCHAPPAGAGCVGDVCAVQPRCRSASLHRSLGARSFVPTWRRDGRAWPPALSYITFCGQSVARRRREKHRRRACIARRQSGSGSSRVARASGRRARGSAAFGVFACLRSPPFGISSLREPLPACVHSLRRKITRKTHSLTLVRLAR